MTLHGLVQVADGSMAALRQKPANFKRFGPSILTNSIRGRCKKLELPADRLQARKQLRENCPLVPGVYGWLDRNQQLVYVGKSKSLRKRLLGYFAKNPSDGKMERIRQHSHTVLWEPISHELLALIREQELIHRWRPEFNSMGQPTRMQPAFLCIGGKLAPNARLARKLSGNYTHAYGPISGTKRLRAAIVCLNHVFKLRDCPDKTKFEFQNQQLLFEDPATAKCIRYELGTCPGPCAAMCSTAHYLEQVNSCIRFLTDGDGEVLAKIETAMLQAAERQAFETAAINRDCLHHLTWLDRRLRGLRAAKQNLNGVLVLPARRNRNCWIILKSGRIVETVLEPKNSDEAEIAIAKVLDIARLPDLPDELLEMSLQLIVIAWFRKYPKIKSRLMTVDQSVKWCRQLISHSPHQRQSA